MATYKVLQDIEAEDKLLGPLTLRQFVYASIVVILGFICFKLASVSILATLPFIPPMVFFGLLAAPFGTDQSSEVWLLAKIRFFLKPRKRIWDQDGIQELVTITVPKKVERVLTNGLSQNEVKSRLNALASTLDSRGWAVKNVNVNMFGNPSYLVDSQTASDRLVDLESLPQEVPNYEIVAADDILDEANNPSSHQLDTMIRRSEQSRKQTAMTHVQPNDTSTTATQSDYWLSSSAQSPLSISNDPVAADPTVEEEQLLAHLRQQNQAAPINQHMKTLQPLGNQTQAAADANAQNRGATTSDDTPNPDILRLANNDDLNVATIAREANRSLRPSESDDEVVISLR